MVPCFSAGLNQFDLRPGHRVGIQGTELWPRDAEQGANFYLAAARPLNSVFAFTVQFSDQREHGDVFSSPLRG